MSHLPKHAMLIALTQRRLSAVGQRRAQSHVDKCDVCRAALTGHERYIDATGAARALDVPAMNYDRIGLALRQAARKEAVSESRRMLYGALAIAATIALGVFGASRLTTENAVLTPRADAAAATSASDNATAATTTVSRVATTAEPETHKASAAAATIAQGDIAEGMLLQNDSAELRLSLWTDTEALLRQGSLVRVAKLRGHQVQLKIERGAITSQVAPLVEGESFEIALNDLVVSVRGTRFIVERSADGRAHVTLSEGVVVVLRGEQQVTRLVAPAQWTDDATTPITAQADAHATLAPMDEGTVSERTAPQLTGTVPSTSTRRIDPTPTAVKNLFARAAPLLAKCHTESLRADPTTPPGLVLALTLGESGQPRTVDVRARTGSVPRQLADCVRAHLLTWHFPIATRGGSRLEIPLNFAPAR